MLTVRGGNLDDSIVILQKCKNLLNKYDNFDISKDSGGYTVRSKMKDFGRQKLLLSELRGRNSSDYFYVLYIVETNSPYDSIDFKDNYWKCNSSIKRILKVSGDINSTTITASDKTNEIGQNYLVKNIIIIKDNDMMQYLSNKNVSTIDNENVISSLESLNINSFFNGFSEYKEIIKKKIL